MAAKPKLIVTRKLPDAVEAEMSELFDAQLNPADESFGRERLMAAMETAHALAPTVSDALDAKVIAAAGPNLGIIANFGVGVNHIDLQAASAKGIAVTNTPDVLTEDTADIAAALMLMAPRRLGEGERMVRAGAWTGWTPTQLMGRRVNGKRLGIIGMGRIGQAVARRARGFGMEILYHNRRAVDAGVEAESGARFAPDLDAMLPSVDFLSINCPQTDETFHLLNARRLDLLPAHAFIINTARGGIIEESSLAERLADGRLGGAGLDVYELEPAITKTLMALDNVVLLPHLGSATVEGRVDMGRKVIENLKAHFAGDAPPDRV